MHARLETDAAESQPHLNDEDFNDDDDDDENSLSFCPLQRFCFSSVVLKGPLQETGIH